MNNGNERESRLPEIHEAIQGVLDTCAHYDNRIYLLQDYEYGMETIEIMYDSYNTEFKCIYEDKHGVYINGRGQGQGDKKKVYIHEMTNINLSEKTLQDLEEMKQKKKSSLDTRINSRDIVVGDLCREFVQNRTEKSRSDHYIYLGKVEITRTYTQRDYNYNSGEKVTSKKVNVYLNLYEDTDYKFKKDWLNQTPYVENGYFTKPNSKIRFDLKLRNVGEKDIDKLRESFKSKEQKKFYYGNLTCKWSK